MDIVILCGGQGARMREETEFRPKPMVEVGGRPLLWHIMRLFGHHGLERFVLCLGYKGDLIKDYFLDYEAHTRKAIDKLQYLVDKMGKLLTKNRIFVDRTKGIGYLSREEAINFSAVGPVARASGVERDLRRFPSRRAQRIGRFAQCIRNKRQHVFSGTNHHRHHNQPDDRDPVSSCAARRCVGLSDRSTSGGHHTSLCAFARCEGR